MAKNKGSISKAENFREMSDFWDTHDLTDHWEKGKEAHFNVSITSEVTYCALERDLSERVQRAAKRHGISSDMLVNIWLQNRLEKEKAK